jgi:ribose 5-phosphate isomerase B
MVAEAILRGDAARGILICSTGIEMSIIANRYAGIRASLCTSTHMVSSTVSTERQIQLGLEAIF